MGRFRVAYQANEMVFSGDHQHRVGRLLQEDDFSRFMGWIPQGSSDIQRAFIEVPWELLANETGHLAKDTSLYP